MSSPEIHVTSSVNAAVLRFSETVRAGRAETNRLVVDRPFRPPAEQESSC
jgi:hypothetical protein